MVISLSGLMAGLFLEAYFYACDIEAAVFHMLGFADDDVSIDVVAFEAYHPEGCAIKFS